MPSSRPPAYRFCIVNCYPAVLSVRNALWIWQQHLCKHSLKLQRGRAQLRAQPVCRRHQALLRTLVRADQVVPFQHALLRLAQRCLQRGGLSISEELRAFLCWLGVAPPICLERKSALLHLDCHCLPWPREPAFACHNSLVT